MDYSKVYEDSLNTDIYWKNVSKEFKWIKSPSKSISQDFSQLPIKCFEDGKLNITENLLDNHAKATPDKIAIIWESNDPNEENRTFTYKQLLEKVSQFANVLKDQGIT